MISAADGTETHTARKEGSLKTYFLLSLLSNQNVSFLVKSYFSGGWGGGEEVRIGETSAFTG